MSHREYTLWDILNLFLWELAYALYRWAGWIPNVPMSEEWHK